MAPDFQLPPGGVVLGLGSDFVEVARVRKAIERHGDRFLKRVFTDEERRYCLGMANPHPHLAARFAAKEAVSKAFTTGLGQWLRWTSIGVIHGERQEPLVELDDKAQDLLARLGGQRVLLTLSHTADHAMAVALLLGPPQPPLASP